MEQLIGKYINGFKITKIETDPFIKGQINLYTNTLEYNWQGDGELIMFRLRDKETNRDFVKSVKNLQRLTLEQLYLDTLCGEDLQCKRANKIEDRWNKLKQYFIDYRYKLTGSHEDGRYCIAISVTDLLAKMYELENRNE